ncbi:DUF2057 domain-containing protein [Photobacterium sp. SDRW27]|uniref:YccT family protein n=1 Tax=Photobacterium obscurum TaxID=2829490 RepID=UPI0022443F7C|nr:DUF2057 domain-containing protein [Photobacterium obscurum]MCW8327697.1 DUF2057 domain-containing protein [Photobacterium obscurum]
MKFRTAILAAAVCGLSFPTLADIKLDLPYSAELVLVNGYEAEGNDPLTLENGENQIAFRYQDGYRENGEHKLFKSDVIIVTFEGQDSAYKLEVPKLRTAQDTQKFNKRPSVSLKDSEGSDVSFAQDKLIKSGLQFGRDYEAEIAAYNQTDKPAALQAAVAVTTLPAAVPAQTAKPAVKGQQPQGKNVAENMLNYWYEQADEATRARFKARINQQ